MEKADSIVVVVEQLSVGMSYPIRSQACRIKVS